MRPETRYAKSGQVSIAYQVTGRGPIDLVWAPGTVSHLDMDWEWPARAQVFERFGVFCRLIRFDKRGTGLSDRPTNAATLDERVDDIRAVMDAVGSGQAALFGVSEGGSMACVFAATYPLRTRALLLWGVQARWTQTPDYPWGPTREEAEKEIEQLSRTGIDREYVTGPGAGAGANADPLYLDWFVRYGRAGGSPAALAALERMNIDIDTRDILPSIRVPTLVMNRTGDPVAHVEAARDLAARIPGARFLEFPGATHGMLDVVDQVLPVVEEFVTGSRSSAYSDRVLATILFVDLVDSTRKVAELGDSSWRTLLARVNEIGQRTVADARGREVKNTGDGFLAIFDGPSRAIQCARSTREALGGLGLQSRAGLHTGECELMGDDVGGVAVHLAARISAAAGPGEIMVSSTVRDLVAGSGFRFEDRGLASLKGFPEQRRLFSVA
ncbi:MAG: adenylate/guanylate cyclase domain-containing protein [Thermoplasmata archaeon]|nr:adenylate/guanylate cyclase domain-containing protein [Thermoplasmata archaeon]